MKLPFGPIDARDLTDKDRMVLHNFTLMQVTKHQFGHRHSLVIGRKGIGKTTLIHQLKRSGEYDLLCEINLGQELDNIRQVLTKEDARNCVERASQMWSATIWNIVIIELLQNDNLRKRIESATREVQYLERYSKRIRRFSESRSQSLVSRALELARDRMPDKTLGVAAAVVRDATNMDLDLVSAQEHLFAILEASSLKIGVAIDTGDTYQIRDSIAGACLQGLMHCVTTVHRRSSNVECAFYFAGELADYFRDKISFTVIKDFRDSITLRWRAPELISMAALRLDSRLAHALGISVLPDYLYDSVPAQAALHKFLPVQMHDDAGNTVETLTYILRRTQLAPRQIILILNELAFRHITVHEGKVIFDRISTDQVSTRMKSCVDIIQKDILASYRELYPRAEEIIDILLPKLSVVHDEKALKKVFNACKIEQIFQMTFFDLKNMFSDLGVIGTIQREVGSTVLGRFSYLQEHRVKLLSADRFCIHPVFSSTYSTQSRQNYLVHPVGSHVHLGDFDKH